MPELNGTRWALVGLLAISGVLFTAGGVALWIGVGLALLAVGGIVWQEWGPTIVTGARLTIHQEGPFDDPDAAYPHGYVCVFHPQDFEPIAEATVLVYTDAPIMKHEAELELTGIGRRPIANRLRIKGHKLRVPVHLADWIDEAVHLRVYSRKPIRVVWLKVYSRG